MPTMCQQISTNRNSLKQLGLRECKLFLALRFQQKHVDISMLRLRKSAAELPDPLIPVLKSKMTQGCWEESETGDHPVLGVSSVERINRLHAQGESLRKGMLRGLRRADEGALLFGMGIRTVVVEKGNHRRPRRDGSRRERWLRSSVTFTRIMDFLRVDVFSIAFIVRAHSSWP